jgi:hypothetical protein
MRTLYPLSATILLLGAAVPGLGQGTIIFNNSDKGLVTWGVDFAGGPVAAGAGKVQLFWAPIGTAFVPWTSSMSGAAWVAANPGWTLQVPVTISAPGRFDGGTLTLTPLSAGGMIDYVVLGWTGTQPTFDAALAYGGLVGMTDKLRTATGNPSIPQTSPVPIANTFPGLLLTVPEPSTFSLLALGALFFLGRPRPARRNL